MPEIPVFATERFLNNNEGDERDPEKGEQPPRSVDSEQNNPETLSPPSSPGTWVATPVQQSHNPSICNSHEKDLRQCLEREGSLKKCAEYIRPYVKCFSAIR